MSQYCIHLSKRLKTKVGVQIPTKHANSSDTYSSYHLIFRMLAKILSCHGKNIFLPHCLSLQCMLFNSTVIVCVCSSENTDGGRGQAHKEVMNTVAEMKKRLPSDKRSRSKASTVEALHYALNCVKQVQGNVSGENE